MGKWPRWKRPSHGKLSLVKCRGEENVGTVVRGIYALRDSEKTEEGKGESVVVI